MADSSAAEAHRRGADFWAELRTRAWANGGRLDISPEELSGHDLALAPRFGLWVRDDHGVVAIQAEDLDEWAPNLAAITRHDGASRRLHSSAPPDAALLRYSDHDRYRSATQKAAVTALLTMPPGAAMMVSMPTGAGKSLLFQLGVRFWRESNPGACAIVITPTIALAEDHEQTLSSLSGLETSRALVSGIDLKGRQETLFAFRRGEVPLLLLSPEAALGRSGADIIEAAQPGHLKSGLGARLAAVFIDEAHIVESWGRTFRPDFQRLPGLIAKLREHNPELRTVLLSATLDAPSRQHLRSAYGKGEWLEIHANAPRYEFDISIGRFTEKKRRDEILQKTIDRAPRPAIVYTTRVDDADELHQGLRRRGYERLAVFTGETAPSDRKAILKAWKSNTLDLVVATSAFGLGVDKSDVRSVIHACLPENALRYYQEIGRAARDGKQGYAVCLWTASAADDESDEACAKSFATGSWLTRPKAEKRWKALKDTSEQGTPFRYDGATLRGILSLDAAREGLGPHTGMPNRQWNMSLLNLLQRANVIDVEAVEDNEARNATRWTIKLREPQFLDDIHAGSIWDRVFELRDQEQKEAFRAFAQFRNLMTKPGRACMLQSLYELVDPETFFAPACGRCVYCQRHSLAPPEHLDPGGLDQVWGNAPLLAPSFAAGITLITPEDPNLDHQFKQSVQRLARAGIESFVVEPERIESAAHVVRDTSARLGFVENLELWLSGNRTLTGVTTAVLLPHHLYGRAADCIERAKAFTTTFPSLPLLLCADPNLEIDRRPLSQIAARAAPIREVDLDFLRA